MQRSLLICSLLIVGLASQSQGAIIASGNASFENNAGIPAGWTVVGTPVNGWGGVVNNYQSFFGVPAQQGTRAYMMGGSDNGGGDTLSTSITGLTAGNSYTLTFWMAAETNNLGRPGAFMEMNLTNSSVATADFSVLSPTVAFNWGDWKQKSLTFTALGPTVSFAMHGDLVGHPSWEFGLDNFQITENVAPVPEPATLTMFGLGALGIGLVSYRRRKLAA